MLLLLAACANGTEDASDAFIIPLRDAGDPVAQGSGFDLSNPTETMFAAQHIVPDLYFGNSPSSEIALQMWDHLQGDNIADTGICPYLVADGPEQIFKTDCRSQEGYNWSGEVRYVEWSEEGQDWKHWTFDVVVDTDLEDKSFERLALTGEIFYASANEDIGLISHTQSNVRIDAEGYWANKLVNGENLEAAWQGLALTGAWETQETDAGDLFVHSGVMDLGQFGGLTFETEGLLDEGGCVGEPQGTLLLDGDQAGQLRFEGSNRCDGCAAHSGDGIDETLACPSREYML
ncbi:MAG: hypothetical protein GY913_32375 [Proteobacteria bacterium]|nr:hypothetical protein [Pseudomonadota bacterium]MCP4921618.1 hypothetical protein [Pseudomonadota bacterium]